MHGCLHEGTETIEAGKIEQRRVNTDHMQVLAQSAGSNERPVAERDSRPMSSLSCSAYSFSTPRLIA